MVLDEDSKNVRLLQLRHECVAQYVGHGGRSAKG